MQRETPWLSGAVSGKQVEAGLEVDVLPFLEAGDGQQSLSGRVHQIYQDPPLYIVGKPTSISKQNWVCQDPLY